MRYTAGAHATFSVECPDLADRVLTVSGVSKSHAMTGFLNERGDAMGRPVGVAIAATGALLVADDVGNKVWRVVPDDAAVVRAAP